MTGALKFCFYGIFFIAILNILISPALAGDKYSSGEMVLTAGIGGSNELQIGEKTQIIVTIANSGLINMKFVNTGTITPDYLPTTALSLSALLEGGDSPVQVSSDPQILGDVKSGSVVQAPFVITVPDSAQAGAYQLPLTLEYKYMDEATQNGLDEIQYTFKEEKQTLSIPITLRKSVRLGINSIDSGDLYVGGDGHIIVNVSNIGSDDGKNTVFYLEPVGKGPIAPYQDSVYQGDFPVRSFANLSYKVSVASNADPSIQYPLTLQAVYTDYQGLTAQSDKKSVSAGFRPKISFTIGNQQNTINSGGEGVITVPYTNTGSDTIYNAQAGITIVDPFTSEDDQAYLGTMKPGDTAVAKFKLNVNSGSTSKQYALDSEIRYTDENLTEFVSDPIKVPVTVTDSNGNMMMIGGIILLVVIIGGGFLYLRRRHHN
ncbi:COG1361 S-layer family protein [Methanospirillum lacunae]|uniref:S-layer protein n=1 Tax=Methanospirillum lacunae TaxID=668570 RepID=A0A2V2NCN1_9EURY|nr:S-layer protein [Methanospirillum lacunae]PWR73063.1 S-layer protein [Methanospirillum lacunae]